GIPGWTLLQTSASRSVNRPPALFAAARRSGQAQYFFRPPVLTCELPLRSASRLQLASAPLPDALHRWEPFPLSTGRCVFRRYPYSALHGPQLPGKHLSLALRIRIRLRSAARLFLLYSLLTLGRWRLRVHGWNLNISLTQSARLSTPQ